MKHASNSRSRDAPRPTEQHEYHSAVEVDETQANWRDWIGPALAASGVILAIALLFLTNAGHI